MGHQSSTRSHCKEGGRVLFKHGTLNAELGDVQEVDTAQDADGGEGIMDALEKEMTDDEAWGMVKDFVVDN